MRSLALLDLHGTKHQDVEKVMIDACAKYDIPFLVITGNSDQMKSLVQQAVKQFDLGARVLINNPGRMIIDEIG